MTKESVLAPYSDRNPWEFIPNIEQECLEFRLLDKMYPINCFQAHEIGFLRVVDSDENESYLNALTDSFENFSGQFNNGICELTYRFKKPVLIRGYILSTSSESSSNDPKSWKINCRNIETNYEMDIHKVENEEEREER